MKYDLTMAFINHADQIVKVTTAEDGGAMLVTSDVHDPKEEVRRVYLDSEEIDRVVEMLCQIKHHLNKNKE